MNQFLASSSSASVGEARLRPPADQGRVACTVLECADDVGGRVRTDRVEGVQPDRGFQVLLTGYPVSMAPPSGRTAGLRRTEGDSRVSLPGLYLWGDDRESGTLGGAVLSGRKAAKGVLTDLSVA